MRIVVKVGTSTLAHAGGRLNIRHVEELVKVLSKSTSSIKNYRDVQSKLTNGAAITSTPQSIRMAITVVATVPILCVYPFVQRYFIQGMTLGAVKG